MTPPRVPRILLRLLIGDRHEEMDDDLAGLYASRRQERGRLYAALYYSLDVLSICARPRFWRNPSGATLWVRQQGSLMRYEVLASVRHMRLRLGSVALNAAGLAAGLVCALFIGIYVRHELAYDRHHEHADRIHRLVSTSIADDRHWAPIGPPVGPAVAEAFPQVEAFARFFAFEDAVQVRHDGQTFSVQRAGMADSTWFGLFTHRAVGGSLSHALDDVGEAAISRSLAERVFGTAAVVGQTLEMPGEEDVLVSAVFEDPPTTTHVPVDLIISMASFYSSQEEWLGDAWTWAGFHTYVMLREGVTPEAMNEMLPAFVDRVYQDRYAGRASESRRLFLQPVTSIHLGPAREKPYLPGSDIRYVWTFGLVGILVLVIAMCNFVNLATAQAGSRKTEIGVRKSLGAPQSQLVRQFLIESVLHAVAALCVALVAAQVLAPLFRDVSGVLLDPVDILRPDVLGPMLLITLGTGLIAGFYPALVVSRFRPIRALGGTTGRGGGNPILRQGLVVLQFSLCIALLFSSAVVWSQLTYLQTKSLGFDREHVLLVTLSSAAADAVSSNPQTIRQRVKTVAGVREVSRSTDRPGARFSIELVRLQSREQVPHQVRIAMGTDHGYPEALGLEFVEGRTFSEVAPRDSSAWVINESAARLLGLDDPTSEILMWGNYAGPIVGVVRDFNFASLHGEIEPLVIPLRPGIGQQLLVRFAGNDPDGVISGVGTALQQLLPGEYFEYRLMSSELAAQYRTEDRLRDVISVFSLLAILVACLGLFGLAAWSARRKTREIGIRKVFGATPRSIVALISSEYVWQIGVATAVSLPAAFLLMRRWLDTFAYRIELEWWFFFGAAGVALGLAILTVGAHGLRAASANPVESLRYS